ncbi:MULTISPECIES: nucleoside deaminase [Cyanophyceae]|uniref:Nucleoside deaminase n=1 Tax=Leptolyngbya subtilissima DQ-A4 TaxID=2933933 RepID=A0ABV0K1D7_9CYAN|nr:nucleoside deaminase [Nodosilinea sp. FACHB-141]MBD2111073.1 nucleoside deaminase [Nodosilinea sp. FACHB-141]
MSDVNEQDLGHVRRAIALSHSAREAGNRPFGAVLADASGQVLAEAENNQITERDCTGHAETVLLRQMDKSLSPDTLKDCTLYASTEPCPMCAGAIFWSGVGRLVYALGSDRLYSFQGESPFQLALGSREVLKHGKRPVEVVGPVLEDEALEAFEGFF